MRPKLEEALNKFFKKSHQKFLDRLLYESFMDQYNSTIDYRLLYGIKFKKFEIIDFDPNEYEEIQQQITAIKLGYTKI